MRNFTERCLRNLQDRMVVFGFEEWDIFFVLGIALFLQAMHINNFILLGVAGGVAGFLKFIKRGKPPKATEHFISWYLGEKKYTAIPQAMSASIKGRNLDLKLNSLQKLLPYNHIEDDLIVFDDDSLTACYEVSCPSVDNFSSEELVTHSNRIETVINNLTDKATYQIFFTLDSNYNEAIKAHKIIKTKNSLIKAMHTQRVQQFEDIQGRKLLRRRRCHFFVNYAESDVKKNGFQFFKNFKKVHKGSAEQIKRHKDNFKSIRQSIEDCFQSGELKLRHMDETEIMSFVYKYLNPDREKQGMRCPKPKENEIFTRQVCCSDFYIDDKKGEYLQYGGYFHKYISLKILPEATNPAILSRITHLSFSEFDVVVNFETPQKEWGMKTIESLRKREYGNIKGMFGIINKDAETKVRQYETLLEEMQQTNQKMFKMQLIVHVYAEELEDVKKKTGEVINVFSSLNSTEMHDERWGAVKAMFVGSLPGWTKESSRWIFTKSLHIADFLPFFSDFRGSGRGECIFFSKSQGLITYDPFLNDLSAYNAIVVGCSGSGKSFTVNQIINQYSKNSPIEIYIDVGGSYRRQTLLKGGEYIDLGLKEKFTINLFDLARKKKLSDFSDQEQTKILILKTKTIGQMMGGFSRFGNTDLIVEDYIFRSIRCLYEKCNQPVLSDLKAALKEVAKQNAQFKEFHTRVVGLLGIWFKEGQYGQYTDGVSTVSLDNDVVCFDFKGLEDFARLQSVMISVVTNFVWGKVMGELGRKKFVVFDECWKLFDTPEAVALIIECYRTSRKYGFSAISVTQSFNDFFCNGLEHAILDNVDTRFILRQKKAETVEKIVKCFSFNEQERRLIESLRVEKGEYSEVFFSRSEKMENISAKIVICPTPIEYWMATTASEDIEYYERINIENPDLDIYTTLEKCAKAFPKGMGKAQEKELVESVC